MLSCTNIKIGNLYENLHHRKLPAIKLYGIYFQYQLTKKSTLDTNTVRTYTPILALILRH